jgi:large subunit ribosomal protein L10
MPKTKQEKEITINDLVDKFSRFKSLIFVSFSGMKVKDTTQLRRTCREAGIDYLVAKKTLLAKALEKTDIKGFAPKEIEGSAAAVFGFEDEVAPAKLLNKFAKDHEALKFLSGILVTGVKEYKILDTAGVKSLAALPTRPELLAKMLGSIKAPLSGLINVLQGNLRGLVVVLNAIKDQKSV